MGETRPDAIRDITGYFYGKAGTTNGFDGKVSGAFYKDGLNTSHILQRLDGYGGSAIRFAASKTVPTGPRGTGQRYLSDLRVYLGLPAS